MAWKDIPEKKVLATLKDGKTFKGTASEKMTIYVDGGVPGGEGDVQGISVTVDPSTYVMTTQLKDGKGGNVGDPATVDLPLESMVVSGEYDDATKSVILTLKNGETVSFSVADLVSGLQTEITAQNPLSADLVAETANKNFVTSEEKEAIGSISEISGTVEELAEDVSGLQGDMEGKQDAIDSNNPLNADYIDDSGSEQKLLSSEEKDAISSLVVNDYNTYVRYVDTGDNNTAHYEDGDGSSIEFQKEAVDDGYEPIALNINFPDYNSFYIKRGMAYRINSSTMQNYSQITGLDDGIYSFDPEEGVTFYVDTTGEIELTKAGLLLVSNGVINGEYCTTGTFFPTDGSSITRYVANQATDETKVEQIDGKMHIITSDDANDEEYVNIWRLGPGTYLVDPTLSEGVPLKVCNASMTGDMVEVTNAYGIWMVTGDSSYDAIYYFPAEDQSGLNTNFPVMYMVSEGEISARTPFASKTYVDNTVQNSVLKGAGAPTTSTAGQKGQLYEDTTNGKVYICTNRSGNTTTWKEIVKAGDNISVLNNNSGYQTASDVSSAIASAVGGITSFEYRVVQTLPQSGEAGVIYLVANSGTSPNIYDEYIWVNNAFEKIGTTDIDLSGYATTQDLEDGLSGKADAVDPEDLPQGSTQNGVITTDDHTLITPSVVSEGQIVVDSTEGKVYIVSEVTIDPETAEEVIIWKEIQTEKEVIYVDMTVTSLQNMTFTVSGYTAYDICMLLDAGVNVIYRLTLTQALPGLAAGIYDFRPIMHASSGGYGGVMSSMVGPSGNNTVLGIASHVDNGTSSFEMRYLQNKIDSNNKLSADLIDSSNSDDKTYQTGTGAPTTSSEGSVGEIYVDKSTGKVYVCTSTTGGTYTWVEVSGTQVNSDWNASSGVARILNKPSLATVATTGAYSDLTGTPTIPTVNNATLTIQKNGTTVQTFTANASSNKTANIEVPVITMQTTDPGEGASLAANNFIAVYEA